MSSHEVAVKPQETLEITSFVLQENPVRGEIIRVAP